MSVSDSFLTFLLVAKRLGNNKDPVDLIRREIAWIVYNEMPEYSPKIQSTFEFLWNDVWMNGRRHCSYHPYCSETRFAGMTKKRLLQVGFSPYEIDAGPTALPLIFATVSTYERDTREFTHKSMYSNRRKKRRRRK